MTSNGPLLTTMHRDSKRHALAPFLALALLGAGCADAGDGAQRAAPRQISDATHAGGTAGFYWLSPMVPAPSPSGVFEPAAVPTLRIDRLAGDGSVAATIATYTGTSGPGGETVRVQDGQFQVNWHTGDFGLDPSATYRIRVLVPGGRELGFADVDVVSSGSQLRNVATSEYIPLLDGRTLPIKFRIEHAAVDRDGDGVLDWADNCPSSANPDQLDTVGNHVGDACRCASVTCAASDQCHVAGVCQPTTGACTNPAAADGTTCDDGDACTQTDTCQAGACTGANPVTCAASDACHAAGACDPSTGACSNPASADGTACGTGSACVAGVCTVQVTYITACGTVIRAPGVYELAADLSCGGGTGVDIEASGVTLRFAGHTVRAGASVVLGASVAVSNDLVQGPGTITGSANSALVFIRSSTSTATGLTFTGSRIGVATVGPFDGTASGNVISNNTFRSGDGGIQLLGNTGTVVSGNDASNLNVEGILIGGDPSIGQVTSGNDVHGNTTNNNGTFGIHVGTGGTSNTISGNTATANHAVDLVDSHPTCDADIWTGNTFATAAPAACVH